MNVLEERNFRPAHLKVERAEQGSVGLRGPRDSAFFLRETSLGILVLRACPRAPAKPTGGDKLCPGSREPEAQAVDLSQREPKR